LTDAAAVARSAYTVTWRELLDYNKSRWNQWLLMKNVFHCCSGAAHVAGAERFAAGGGSGDVLIWAAAWRCNWCRAWNWTEISVLSRL
jgi:hypothetical protein